MTQPEPNQRRVRRFRWVWRSILGIVLLGLTVFIMSAAKHTQAIQELQANHSISVSTEPGVLLDVLPWSWQRWLTDKLGKERLLPLQVVTAIRIQSVPFYVENGDLSAVTDISKINFARIGELKHLIKLDLSNNRVTDAELFHLKGLTNLEILELSSTQVSDAGLVHLKDLTKLQALTLADTQVSDAGLAHLQGLSDLYQLDLSGTQVTDHGLQYLKRLKKLDWLHLAGTRVGDTGLSHLKELVQLADVNLSGTAVSDAGLIHLKDSPLSSGWI